MLSILYFKETKVAGHVPDIFLRGFLVQDARFYWLSGCGGLINYSQDYSNNSKIGNFGLLDRMANVRYAGCINFSTFVCPFNSFIHFSFSNRVKNLDFGIKSCSKVYMQQNILD